jgi:hypothetical protein
MSAPARPTTTESPSPSCCCMNARGSTTKERSDDGASAALSGFELRQGRKWSPMAPPSDFDEATSSARRHRRHGGWSARSLRMKTRQPAEPALPADRQGAVRMIGPCSAVRDADLRTSRLKITLEDLLPDPGAQFLDLPLPARLTGPAPALKASSTVSSMPDLIALGQIGHADLLRHCLKGDLRLQRQFRLLRRNGSDANWPTGPKLGRNFTKSRRQLIGRSASPRLSSFVICLPASVETALV